MAILVPGLKVESNCIVTRKRELPIAGELLVKVGDRVSFDSVVAKANLPGDLTVIRLPEIMGLQLFEVINALKVEVGDCLSEGQLVAEYSGLLGLLKTKYLSPCEGKIEFFSDRTGHMGIRKAAWPIELKAYISGAVTEIMPGKGLSITTDCSFVQGIFGLGGERTGHIKVIAEKEQLVTEKLVPDNCKNLVLVGGMQPSESAIRKAAACGAVGLVVGSLDDQLIKSYLGYDLGIAITGDEKIPTTLIMTEGFGTIPMSAKIYKILSENDGSEVSINGATQVRAGAVRPEIIIPKKSSTSKNVSIHEATLELGCQVRVIRVPYFGQIGEVVELPVQAQKIATGSLARVAKLRLSDNTLVTVPRANLELVAS